MPKKCAVAGCPNTMGHRFPQNPELRRKWIEALGLDSFCLPYDRLIVCYKHFVPSDYASNVADKSRKRLRFSAYPTIFIKTEPKISDAPKPARNDLPAAKTNKTYSIITKRSSYGVFSKKTISAQVEEISVVGEPAAFNEQNSLTVDSITDEVLEIPVEEMIIKEEPEESYSYVEDPLSLQTEDEPPAMPIVKDEKKVKLHQDPAAAPPCIPPKLIFFNNPALNKHLQIKKYPRQTSRATTMTTTPKIVRLSSQSPRGRSFVIQNTFSLAVPTTDVPAEVKAKNTVDEFKESDMADQICALKFYNLAMQLKNSLRAKIRMLEDEIAALKKNASYCHLYHKDLPKPPEGQVYVEPFATAKQPDAPRQLMWNPPKKVDTPAQPAASNRSSLVLERGSTAIAARQLEVLPPPEEGDSRTKNESIVFSGAYRIVELEYFSNAVCKMHHHHQAECPKGKMVVDSETLSGIAGKWTFKCVECGHKRIILTDPSSCTKVSSNWLTWMVIQSLSRLLHAQMIFSNMGVPFLYKISPTTLKVLTFKRQIANVDGAPVSIQSSRKRVRRKVPAS